MENNKDYVINNIDDQIIMWKQYRLLSNRG